MAVSLSQSWVLTSIIPANIQWSLAEDSQWCFCKLYQFQYWCFCCKLNAYRNLHLFETCEQGVVSYYYDYIDWLDPARFQPHLNHFMNDVHDSKTILLEYLQNTEELNCVNYSDDCLQAMIVGLRRIHSTSVYHCDIYSKNILIMRGHPDRVVWIDFDVAVTFNPGKSMGYQIKEYCKLEIRLVKSFGDLLVCSNPVLVFNWV